MALCWRTQGRLLGSSSSKRGSRAWFPTSFRAFSALPITATRSSSSSSSSKLAAKPAAKQPLFEQHKTFTHGGNFWRDDYHLEQWATSERPVVYLGNVYNNNYELKLRLGDWCWLTQDPCSGQYMTIKFLSRPTSSELYMNRFVKEHCHSPFVSTIEGSFKIPHHLAQTDARYAGIEFDAVFYPLAGTDLRRISSPWCYPDHPDNPLPSRRRKRCIRDLTLGLAALHEIGVVHGDIHPGNVALPAPSRRHIEQYLATGPPLVHQVRRKDGAPTHPTLPRQVTEPVDIGFGEGNTTILDLGYSFRATEGGSYSRVHFPKGTALPPELLCAGATTTLPFKVDSWHLGLCMFYILTEGGTFVDHRGYGRTDEALLDQYEEQYAALADGDSELTEWIPDDLREASRPILMSLLCLDPARRCSVEELTRNKWLMDG